MSFIQADAGRSKSRRPKQRNDCTVRALSIVTSLGYDRAFDLLAASGRKSSKPFDLEAWARKNLFYDGAQDTVYFKLDKMPYIKDHHQAGQAKRYRIWDFIKDNPKGRFIVSTASHVFAVVDGKAYDDTGWHYAENRPVYGWLTMSVACYNRWQVYAIRRAIKKGRPMMRRCVAIVDAYTEKQALREASRLYEWAIRKEEDLAVELYKAPLR